MKIPNVGDKIPVKAECDASIAAAVKARETPDIIVHRLRRVYGITLAVAYGIWKVWKKEYLHNDRTN